MSSGSPSAQGQPVSVEPVFSKTQPAPTPKEHQDDNGPLDNSQTVSKTTGSRYVVLTGNPNCGKTTIFNLLTGLRAKVGNYAGVTVERKEGRLRATPPGVSITVLDLPGTYSLSPKSLDEQISRDVLFNRIA